MTSETVVFRGSPSLLLRAGPLLAAGVVAVGAAAAAMALRASESAAWWILIVIAALAAAYVAAEILVLKATDYEVTSQRVRIRTGLLTKRTEELELYRANDTALIEPFWLRLFGLGTIEIETMEPGSPRVHLQAIHDAGDVRERLRTCIEECRDRKRVRLTEFDDPSPSFGSA